jgi:hypothetical protein
MVHLDIGSTGGSSWRMLKKVSSKAAGEVNTAGVPSVGYSEDVDEPRTKLGAIFSIPLR